MNKAHEKLIDGWVHKTVAVMMSKFDHDHVDYDDLIQEGWLSACKAYQSWDDSKGTSLQSWVLSQMKRDLWRFAEKEVGHHTGRRDWDFDEVSLDDLIEMEQVDELIDYDLQELLEHRYDCARLASFLSEDDVRVINLIYFEDLSEREVAERLNVHRSVVRRIHRQALEKMRGHLDPLS